LWGGAIGALCGSVIIAIKNEQNKKTHRFSADLSQYLGTKRDPYMTAVLVCAFIGGLIAALAEAGVIGERFNYFEINSSWGTIDGLLWGSLSGLVIGSIVGFVIAAYTDESS
jgi:hypothetical protein